MQTITTIGLEIAKSVFQVHGINAQVIIGRQLKRRRVRAFFHAATVPGWHKDLVAPRAKFRLSVIAYD